MRSREELCPMSPDEIKIKLNNPCVRSCYDCRNHKACLRYTGYAALAYIQQLEERIMGMKIQMHGDCGVCKHRHYAQVRQDGPHFEGPCHSCIQKETRPNWEYEGLPEVKSK